MGQFELLVFSRSYFVDLPPEGLAPFVKFINKAYNKPRYKFEYVTTSRVGSYETFFKDFHITEDGGFVLMVMLGPKDSLKTLERDFDSQSTNVEEAFNCDIPQELCDDEDLRFDAKQVVVTAVDKEYRLDKDLYRVLGSSGFVAVNEGIDNANNELVLELTCVSSFMKQFAPKQLEYCVENFLKTLKILEFFKDDEIPSKKFRKVVLEASVIRQHKLLDYYTKHCGFVHSGKPDFLVDFSSKDSGPFTNQIEISRPFNIEFIHRDILL